MDHVTALNPVDRPSIQSSWPHRWRAVGEPPVWSVASALLLPFLAAAVKALMWSPSGLLRGDQAVMDLQVRQALKFRLLLGVYDRFGWHHPGPIYAYGISFFERLSGVHNPAQAQIATAAMINGLSAVGVVLVVGHRHGRRSALGAAAAVAAAAALLGSISLDDPWTPRVVILPLLFFGVLTAAAMGGSSLALVASGLVGSAAVQTDISTLPLVAVSLVLAAVGALWARRASPRRVLGAALAPEATTGAIRAEPEARRPAITGHRLLLLGGLLSSCALLWLPVAIQQIGERPGNLSLLWRFFAGHEGGPDLGFTGGLSVLGTASSAVFGLPTPGLDFDLTPGLIRFSVTAAILVGLTAATVLLGSRAATMCGASLVGLGAAVLAADHIIGMPWEYLLGWSAAPVALGLVAAGVLAAERTESTFRPAVPLVAVAAIVGLAVAVFGSPVPAYTSSDVTVATNAVLQRHQVGQTVGLIARGLQPLSDEEGVADQLVRRGIRYTVPQHDRFQFPFSVDDTPTEWVAFTVPGAPIPPGYEPVASTSGLVVSIGTGPASGW